MRSIFRRDDKTGEEVLDTSHPTLVTPSGVVVKDNHIGSASPTQSTNSKKVSFSKELNINTLEVESTNDIVNPWEVSASSPNKTFNYDNLNEQFGCQPISQELLQRFERVTNKPLHPWLRRGIFYSHKDLELVLDDYEKKKPIYIYTGRGPSSDEMHLGHIVPFQFTQWLQEVFDAQTIIQMSDDEKYYFKGPQTNTDLAQFNELTYRNARSIIACGFDPKKTYIFSNLKTVGGNLYENVVKLMCHTNGNKINSIYGLNLDNSIGQLSWPCFQCAPAYSNSFPDLFPPNNSDSKPSPHVRCLVPMAIDQVPYFRMARDFGHQFRGEGYLKPSTIHSKFLPGLEGIHTKMSSSGNGPVICLSDTQRIIEKKLNRYAYSGGQETVDRHRLLGGNPDVDVSFQYLRYFMDDDTKLAQIEKEYRNGHLLSGQLKKLSAQIIANVVSKHQEALSKVDDTIVQEYFNPRHHTVVKLETCV